MRDRRLGRRLRALIAAAPLIGPVGCSNYPCDPPPENETFWLTRGDGGSVYFPTDAPIAIPSLPDGGLDCEAGCNNYSVSGGVAGRVGRLESCAVESDGGNGLPAVTCV